MKMLACPLLKVLLQISWAEQGYCFDLACKLHNTYWSLFYLGNVVSALESVLFQQSAFTLASRHKLVMSDLTLTGV